MTKKFTTMRVYEKDKEVLLERFGGHAHQAFHRVVAGSCTHPESDREYVTAEFPMPEQDALVENQGRRILVGFHCLQCKKYIFKKILSPAVPS